MCNINKISKEIWFSNENKIVKTQSHLLGMYYLLCTTIK